MHRIIDLDKQLFLEINKWHTEFLDSVMLFFSSYISWFVIACLILLWTVFFNDKALRKPVAAFALLSVFASGLLNQVVKVIVERPRPIHEDAFNGIIHAIEKYDESYSFFSAHSSTSFALAVFALLVIRKSYFSVVVLAWALIVAYSRIYLGKHYPLDVLTGILFGTMIAAVSYRMYKKYLKRKTIKVNTEIYE